jgi:hypothetical protein
MVNINNQIYTSMDNYFVFLKVAEGHNSRIEKLFIYVFCYKLSPQ